MLITNLSQNKIKQFIFHFFKFNIKHYNFCDLTIFMNDIEIMSNTFVLFVVYDNSSFF